MPDPVRAHCADPNREATDASMPARKLTQKMVDQIPLSERPQVVRDAAVTGLLLKIGKTSKAYAVQRELWVGERGRRRLVKTVRHTLGRTDELTLDEARTQALAVLAAIRSGRDPNEPKVAAEVWTVEQAYAAYASDARK